MIRNKEDLKHYLALGNSIAGVPARKVADTGNPYIKS